MAEEKCHKNNEECIENVEDIECKAAVNNPRAHLVPRPSEDEGDPLNWPIGLKILILFQVCWLAFVSMMEVSPAILISRHGLIAGLAGNMEYCCHKLRVFSLGGGSWGLRGSSLLPDVGEIHPYS